MAVRSARLLENASATGSYVRLQTGGRVALVLIATAFPTTTTLELKAQDGTTDIVVATLTANGVSSYDLPPGEYRMQLVGGSPSGVYADLVSISHY